MHNRHLRAIHRFNLILLVLLNRFAEWTFVPMRAGNYYLRCPIPGHTEAGMTGTIAIAP
ncbi:MAG TPA: hypothetical protein DDW76_04360 [Cyanobacteria bacterium UBA11369]|nr:hypothetical protein [Cyanobacteria bacterium UBA11371]HBE32264.1 hypothetical protein [Cyanobacteria bacterium UBA11368]HBE48042.1 hypothetical protein [Cyanobacteria bacterium UBA11369]